MSDLAAAAASMGIPEALVERSAEAKAAETGSTVEEILAAWAGGESAPAGSAPAEAEPEAAAAEQPEEEEATEPEPAAPPPVSIEIPGDDGEGVEAPAGQPAGVSRAEVPAEVTMAEAANLPVVVTVPTTGIKERTNFVVPKWLAALFFLVPLLALFALGGSATGVCGEATELETNVITGEVVNCDGTPFEGSAVGGGGTDFIALGEAIYQGQEIGSVNCAGCHGAGGGGGVGPAMNGVINVFGSCSDHIEWVELGTQGFQGAGRSTYGDTNKPVGGAGIMPGFSSLSSEQLAAVTAFERVRFGGASPEETLTDCGLVEAPAEGEETPAEGEESAEPVGDPPPDTVPDQTDDGSSETSGDGA